jgi:uncharacterized protein YecT (DUF1311 family)
MPISFSMMIVLGTQFAMPIADGAPKFDIARECRVDSTQAFDLSAGLNETVKRCVADEQQALTQLQTQWSQFRESDAAQCTAETNIGGTPSYVDLLTCLQLAKEARQLPKQ